MAEHHIVGCILGTAVGDALGLPYEGVSRSRAPRLLGPPERHRFLFGRGMVSDDTEHTCMVAQSLIAAGDDETSFTRDFARRLRWWFLLLPAGLGRATLKSCLKLWIGISPKSSGVFSAGNGPAMRAAIFGAALDDLDQIAAYVRSSTRITHSDPKAEFGAKAVALAAYFARREPDIQPIQYFERLTEWIGPEGEELCELIHAAVKSVAKNQSTIQFADEVGLGRGVSGYIYHTVPVVIHAWLNNRQNFQSAVTSVIECGGDADTTAAIVGGIVGTTVGESGIPSAWMETLCEWPGTVSWMRNLAIQLSRSSANSTTERPVKLNAIIVLFRNLFFLKVVLFHGFRRLFPPY